MKLVVAISALVLGATTWLTFGAEVEETVTDRSLDYSIEDFPKRPDEKGLVDITSAQVLMRDGHLHFRSSFTVPIPRSLEGGYFDAVWRIDGNTDWVLTASLTDELGASLTDSATGAGWSTSVGGFPGAIDVEGDRLEVSVDLTAVPTFPRRFRWSLSTVLNTQASDPRVGIVYDFAPEGRMANYRL